MTRATADPLPALGGDLLARPAALGVGAVVSAEGCFVTGWHVVEGASRVCVSTAAVLRGRGYRPHRRGQRPGAAECAWRVGRGLPLPGPHAGADGSVRGERRLSLARGHGDVAQVRHGARRDPAGDSPRLIQVSMPVQPRHFGVSLLDASSHVVGVVIAQLEKIGMLMQEGHLPESVNHPVRGIILAALPNSLPETARPGLAWGSTGPLADAEIARLAEPACGLVLLDR